MKKNFVVFIKKSGDLPSNIGTGQGTQTVVGNAYASDYSWTHGVIGL